MAKIETYACDVCGKQKGETNNWFVGVLVSSTPSIFSRIVLAAFSNAAIGDDTEWTHLCGESCVHKFVSQNLASLHPVKDGRASGYASLQSASIEELIPEGPIEDEEGCCTHNIPFSMRCAECEALEVKDLGLEKAAADTAPYREAYERRI